MLTNQTQTTRAPILAVGPELFFLAEEPTGIDVEAIRFCLDILPDAHLFDLAFFGLNDGETINTAKFTQSFGVRFVFVRFVDITSERDKQLALKLASMCDAIFSPALTEQMNFSIPVINAAKSRLLDRLIECSFSSAAFTTKEFLSGL